MKKAGGKILLLTIVLTSLSALMHLAQFQFKESEYQRFYEEKRNKALSQGGISVAEFDEILVKEAEYKKHKKSYKFEMETYDYVLILVYCLICVLLVLAEKKPQRTEVIWVPLLSALVFSVIYGNEVVLAIFLYLLFLLIWRNSRLAK